MVKTVAGISAALPPHWAEALSIGLEAVARYKLRTALSITGVVAGVAGVIAMVSVGEGARREVLSQVEALGVNNFAIRPRFLHTADAIGRAQGLTVEDSDRLRSLVPGIKGSSDLITRYLPISGPAAQSETTVLGVEPSFAQIMRLEVERGRWLHELDVTAGPRRVAVLGPDLSNKLFGARDPVAQQVWLRGEPYEVAGVLQRRASSGASTSASIAPFDFDNGVLVPLATLLDRQPASDPAQRLDGIWMQVSLPDQVETVASVAEEALSRLHRGLADYDVFVPRELMRQRYQTQRTFNVVVGSIAALALLVGGIGITNIMLASVLERTPEIGLRRTVGATRRSVAAQFLTESVLMTATGGAGGVLVGVAVSSAISRYAGWPTQVSTLAVMLALVVSISLGVVFGLYPAMRAARLEPIDAVRHE